MKDYIYKLRAKPEEVRKQYMFLFLLIAMILVGGVWVYGLTQSFSKSPDDSVVTLETNSEIKPFSLFGQSVKNIYQNAKANASDPFRSKITQEKEVIPVENQKMIPLTVIDNQ